METKMEAVFIERRSKRSLGAQIDNMNALMHIVRQIANASERFTTIAQIANSDTLMDVAQQMRQISEQIEVIAEDERLLLARKILKG
jgi:hypothetical protein